MVDKGPLPPPTPPPQPPKPGDFGVTEEAIQEFHRIQSSTVEKDDPPLFLSVLIFLGVVSGASLYFRGQPISFPSMVLDIYIVSVALWQIVLLIARFGYDEEKIAGFLSSPVSLLSRLMWRAIRPIFRREPAPHPQWEKIAAYLKERKHYEEARRIFEHNKRKREAWEQRQERAKKLRQIACLRKMDPVKFERLVAEAYRNFGWRIHNTPASGDKGVDAYLEKNGSTWILQCKRYSPKTKAGAPLVRELIGTVVAEGATGAILVTTGSFSKGAREVAHSVGNVQLIDHEELLQLFGRAFPDSSAIPEDISLD